MARKELIHILGLSNYYIWVCIPKESVYRLAILLKYGPCGDIVTKDCLLKL